MFDPTGTKLATDAIDTIKHIVGEEYAGLINDSDNDGYIDEFSVSSDALAQNEGLSLINDLVASENTYGYYEDDFIETLGGVRGVDSNIIPLNQNGVESLNNNFDWRIPGKTADILPPAGFQSMVVVDTANWSWSDKSGDPVESYKLAFHELYEAKMTVEKKMQYAPEPGSGPRCGSHRLSGEAEGRWHAQRALGGPQAINIYRAVRK